MNRLFIVVCATVITFSSCHAHHDRECSIVQQLVTVAVHKAAAAGQVKQLEFLRLQLSEEFKAAVNTADGEYAHTPLHYAVYSGSVPTARLLLEHGADPNARCVHGDTPLSFARQGCNPYMIALLINHGAQDMDGKQLDNTHRSTLTGRTLGHK